MLPEATTLIVNLFDTLTKLLPSQYFSSGGDELNVPCYVRPAHLLSVSFAEGDGIDERYC